MNLHFGIYLLILIRRRVKQDQIFLPADYKDKSFSSNILLSFVKYNFWTKIRREKTHPFSLYSSFSIRVGQLKCVPLQNWRNNHTSDSQSVSVTETFSWPHSETEERPRRRSGSVGEAIWVEFLGVFPVLLRVVQWIRIHTYWSLLKGRMQLRQLSYVHKNRITSPHLIYQSWVSF